MLRPDQRYQFVHDQLGNGGEVAVALHQAGHPGQVGLQPVLFLIRLGGLPQRLHHRVDVVLEFSYLTLCLDRNGPGEITSSNRAGHLGDRAHLAGEVASKLIDVLSQPLPGA